MRRISENVLGVMAQKWQVLRTIMQLEPEKVTTIVLAIMVLHNYLRGKRCYLNVTPMEQQSALDKTGSWLDLPQLCKGQNHSNAAKAIRKEFSEYFNHQGAVRWQLVAARIDA